MTKRSSNLPKMARIKHDYFLIFMHEIWLLPITLAMVSICYVQDGWPSGLRRTPGKRVGVNAPPGFESPSIRHFCLFLGFSVSCG